MCCSPQGQEASGRSAYRAMNVPLKLAKTEKYAPREYAIKCIVSMDSQ